MRDQPKKICRSCLIFFIGTILCSWRATASDTNPVFTKDILPILQEKCQACHRPDQVAPMSLLTYQEVRPWVKSILKEVTAKNMPPFHAKSPKGYFKDDHRLTDNQIQLISNWVKNGAPKGNPADAPEPIEWGGSAWSMEKPDLILDFPEATVSSRSIDDFVLYFSDYVFQEDTWVQALEFKSSNYEIIHHVGIFAVDSRFEVPDELMLLDSEDGVGGRVIEKNAALIEQNYLYTWLPGQRIEYRDEGQGYRIRKGERFVLQVHFAPSDVETKCTMQMGLEYVNGEIRYENMILPSLMTTLVIPPHNPSFRKKQSTMFLQDSLVQSFLIHMHLRGISAKFVFHYPDGKVETAFEIPKYNFDWQRVYHLAKPYKVPKGTKVEFHGTWDNSTNNPLNPDPNALVVWGEKTSDEMYGASIYHTVDLDEPIVVENGREIEK
jgi:hypothetical protein